MTGSQQGFAGMPSREASSSASRAVLVPAVLGTALAYMSDDMLNLAIPSVSGLTPLPVG